MSEFNRLPQIKHVRCPKCAHLFRPFFVEKATRGSKRVSRGLTWAVGTGLIQGHALDYGCGLMRNADFLEQHFHPVTYCDTRIQVERLKVLWPNRHIVDVDSVYGQFECVLVLSVVHVLPDEDERIKILDHAGMLCDQGGKVVVEVPTWDSYYRDITAARHNDGYVMGAGQCPTFYAPFSAGKLRMLIADSGLREVKSKVVKTSTTLICEPQR